LPFRTVLRHSHRIVSGLHRPPAAAVPVVVVGRHCSRRLRAGIQCCLLGNNTLHRRRRRLPVLLLRRRRQRRRPRRQQRRWVLMMLLLLLQRRRRRGRWSRPLNNGP
jgi:hypothetical protein